ncbi:alpha/beta hydrolase [bacterium]|nr:MAG: alpha/beta hydrolase [bacterium]
MLPFLLVAGTLAVVSEREIDFKTPDGLTLKGTFLGAARNQKSVRAILLLPGSGPTDRDGNQPGFKTDLLKGLSAALSENDVATFRFDKRAVRTNASQWPKELQALDAFFSFENHLTDAEAALECLRSQPGIDARHVGVAGHSEGGLIAMNVAAKLGTGKVSALALLSTAGRPLAVVLEEQIGALLKRQTSDEAIQKDYLSNLRASIAFVEKSGTPPPDVLPGLKAIFSPGTSRYLQTILPLDPATLLPRYPGNVLVVQGALDSQVSVTADFPLLTKALKSRKRGHQTMVLVPGASHNFKTIEGANGTGIEGPILSEAVDGLVKWTRKSL